MVLRIDVVCAALEAVFGDDAAAVAETRRVVELTPRGRQLDDALATELAGGDLCVLCGRYEGIDERVTHLVTDRVSIGPYVLSRRRDRRHGAARRRRAQDRGRRLQPRERGREIVLAGPRAALEYPQYTRPAEFRGWAVPDVLLSRRPRRHRALAA